MPTTAVRALHRSPGSPCRCTPKEAQRRLGMRLTQDEYEGIRERAHIAGLTVSEYIRRAALARRIDSRADMAAWSDLRKLTGQLKNFHTVTGGVYADDTAALLFDISQTIKKLLK